jgi:hypothetical protein
MSTTSKKGTKGVANVIADLTNKDYFPFIPLTDVNIVDLVVANKDLEFKKIQIKYRSINKGKIEIPTESVVNGKRVQLDVNKVDLWAVYCPDNKQIYYVSSSELKNKKVLTLRIDCKQKQKTIHYAEDYLDIEKAWNKNGE